MDISFCHFRHFVLPIIVHLFKKIAILKWGNHSRYEEYKNETLKLIDLYAIKKPEKTEEVAIFKQGFDYLITHLENEPNPFIKENK